VERGKGRGKKRCGVARTDETSKWYERTVGRDDSVERSRGMETLMA
jgi:hypothetical protein